MSDKPGVVVPDIPPRPKPTMIAAVAAFILSLLALILLHVNFELGIWLSAASVVAAGVTVYLLWQEGKTGAARGTAKR